MEYPALTMRIYVLLAIILACLTVSAQSKSFNACADKSSSTMEANDCLEAGWKASDRKLNQTYTSITRKISGTRLQDLRIAQRDWVQFRDANCKNASEIDTGVSGGVVVLYSCLDTTTRHRITELESMYGGFAAFPQ
jgi:uncharacterized protein YecT (DUF1311 family)